MNDHIVRPGALGWGIKDSFRAYLSRQVDFSRNVDDGGMMRLSLRNPVVIRSGPDLAMS